MARVSELGQGGKKAAKRRGGRKASPESSQVTCPECHGEGTIMSGHRECPECHGRGTVPRTLARDMRKGKSRKGATMDGATVTIPEGATKCKACKGSGKHAEADCDACKGKGYFSPEPDERAKAAGGAAEVAVGKSVARSAIRIARALTKGGSGADDAVDDAVDDLLEAAGQVATAQAVDDAGDVVGKGAGKRDFDPDVGGGVDRDKLDAGDFVFPDTRDFPVVKPGDVSDAVSSWGRYKGDESFDSFKSKLTALARRKGPRFAAELPEEWTEKKPKRAKTKAGKGSAVGTVTKGKRKAQPPEQDGKIVPGEGAVSAVAGTESVPAPTDPGPGKGKGKGKKKGKGKGKGLKAAVVTKGNGKGNGRGKGKGNGKGKGEKVGKGKGTIPAPELRLHDLLCPGYSTKALKGLYPLEGEAALPLPDVLSPDLFGARLAELSSGGRKAAKGSLGEAYQDFAAASRLSAMTPPSFLEMRDAAHKRFTDAYPDVRVKPGLIDPESLRRPFLSGATPETSSVTRVPMPDVKPQLRPGQFQRGPLTQNETRPTLSGGESVARKGKGKKGAKVTKGAVAKAGSRDFYTNAAKDEHSSAMSLLHDHIVGRYPGICPMAAVQPGTAIDSDGLAGSPAEMRALGPSVGGVPTPGGAGGGTLRGVGKSRAGKKAKGKARSTKGAAKAPDLETIKALVDEQVGRVQAKGDREVKRLEKRLTKREGQLRELLSRPDPTQRAHRGASLKQFRPRTAEPTEGTDADKAKTNRTIRALKGRLHDPNSAVAQRAQEELMRILEPEEFARMATADDVD